MGEVEVFISDSINGVKIHPFMWAVVNKKIDFKETVSHEFDPNSKLKFIFEYRLLLEANYINLFCKELLEGDFSMLKYYSENVALANEELFRHYQRID